MAGGVHDIESAPQQPDTSVTHEPTTEGTPTATNNLVLEPEPVPNERKNRARKASILLFTITTILVLVYCFLKGTVDEYYPYTPSTQNNATSICYRKRERKTFPALFTTAFSLCSIVIGTLVDRLTLVVEESYHRRERYGGSWKKMIKACFSGIKWAPVFGFFIPTALIVLIMIAFTGLPWFELRYLVYVISGIGVGPLVMQLLNLNTQSEVHISMILEEKGMYVANGLAWSFYLRYLKEALPKFKDAMRRYETEAGQPSISRKMLLLIPHDCFVPDEQDFRNYMNIEFQGYLNPNEPAHKFPFYRLTVNENEHKYFVIQYITEPLETLWEMSQLEMFNAVKRENCGDEVTSFYTTLYRILEKPPHQECKGMSILVPIKVGCEHLGNGGLVRCIMQHVELSCEQPDGASKGKSTPGFSNIKSKKQSEPQCSNIVTSPEPKRQGNQKVASEGTEQEPMIPKNNVPTQEGVQEGGDGSGNGAGTSGNSSRPTVIVHTHEFK